MSSTPADWDALTPTLDARVRGACGDAARVEQPLWPWVQQKRSVRRAFLNPRLALSVAQHRYDAQPVLIERTLVSSGS